MATTPEILPANLNNTLLNNTLPFNSEVLEKWQSLGLDELREAVAEHHQRGDILEGIIKQRSLTMFVGDSGLGKSPFLYQLAIAIAAGVDVMGRSTVRSRVAIFDYENGYENGLKLAETLCNFLQVNFPRERLIIAPDKAYKSVQSFNDFVQDHQPQLVIVDPLKSIFPRLEEKDAEATEALRTLRGLIGNHNLSVIGVHHTRKPERGVTLPSLENDDEVLPWFHEMRGPKALVNYSDLRLGIDRPRHNRLAEVIVRGFARVTGVGEPLYLGRAYNDQGDPVGYLHLQGREMLSEQDIRCFDALPGHRFSFTEGRRAVDGMMARATYARTLKSLVRAGFLAHDRVAGVYERGLTVLRGLSRDRGT